MRRLRITVTKADLEFSQISYQMSPENVLCFLTFFYSEHKYQNKNNKTIFNEETYVSFKSFHQIALIVSHPEVCYLSAPLQSGLCD